MAVGDVFNVYTLSGGIQTVTAGSTYAIQPSSGVEAVIHNVWVSGAADIELTDGTNIIDADSLPGAGAWDRQTWHVTNTLYLLVKNTGAVSIKVGFDGVQTK